MQRFSHENQDEPVVNPIDDFENAHEYTDLTNKIRQFDKAREASYAQVAYIMHGQGGDTRSEAVEILNVLVRSTAKSFSATALEMIAESSSLDEAKAMITNLFLTDDAERVTIVSELDEEGRYAPASREGFVSGLDDMLEENDEDDYAAEFEEMYAHACATDLNGCLAKAPYNVIEIATMERNAKRDFAIRAAYDVAKMAGAALIAVALTRRKK